MVKFISDKRIIAISIIMIVVSIPCFGQDATSNKGVDIFRNGEKIDTIITSKLKETKLEKLILLSSDKEMKESTSIEDLKLITKEINLIFNKLFSKSERSGKIMIQIELNNKSNIINFAVRDDLDLEIMKVFEEQVKAKNFPKARKQPVKFQMIYKVNSIDD